jgi:uncharacterized repeat protein (TIGR01451 family)
MTFWTLLAACCAALAACAPTRPVYNGGLADGVARTLSGPDALAPTEAASVFETDYAPPAKNAAYAGPTNRVRVDVPESLLEHPFVTLKTAGGPHVFSMLEQAGAAAAAAEPAAQSDARAPRVMAGAYVPESLTGQEQGLAVSVPEWPFVAATSSASRVAKAAKSVEVRYTTKTLQTAGSSVGSLGLGDSDAMQEAVTPQGIVRPAVINSPMLMETSRAAGIRATSKMIGNVAGRDTAKEVAGPDVLEQSLKPESALALETLAAPNDYRGSRASAVHKAPSAPASAVSSDVARVEVESDMIREVGNANYLIAATTGEGWLVFKRSLAPVVRVESDAVSADAASNALKAASLSEEPLALADSVSAQNAHVAEGGLKAATVESPFSYGVARGLRTARWTRVAADVTSAGLPTVYVMKEGRLFDARGVERLIAGGILRDRPRSGVAIAYRLHVLNVGEAVAADVRVLDRLDSSTALLVNSMATNSEAATAKYFLETNAIEVALPRLEVGQYFVIEFFVEPVPVGGTSPR